MNLTIIAALISAAMAGLAGWGAAWTIQGRTIDSLKLEAKDERIAQQRAARQSIERATGAVIAAQNDAQRRAAVLAGAADSARSESDGLRQSITTAMRANSVTLDACNANAAATGELLSHCSQRYTDVARAADGWQSAAMTLQAAWPR